MDLAEIEAEIFLEVGNWKNFDELEDSINIEELAALRKVINKREHQRNTFAAALKGIKLDDPEKNEYDKAMADINRRAQMRMDGLELDDDQLDKAELGGLGIMVITE